MAITRTVPEFVMDIRRAADIEAESFKPRFPDSELAKYAMVAINRFWRLGSEGPQAEIGYQTSTLATTDGDAVYAFADFTPDLTAMMQLVLMEILADGVKYWLNKFEHHEHAFLSDPQTSTRGMPLKYRIIGTSVELAPSPGGIYTVTATYLPLPTQLGGTPMSWDTINGLMDEWVPAFGAREVALKNKWWDLHDRMERRLSALDGDVRAEFRKRDQNSPPRVTDESYAFDRFGRRMRAWR